MRPSPRKSAALRSCHPRSLELSLAGSPVAARRRADALDGRWAGGFPVFAERAEGAYLTDVDGHRISISVSVIPER